MEQQQYETAGAFTLRRLSSAETELAYLRQQNELWQQRAIAAESRVRELERELETTKPPKGP